jgi:hypothetical protein
MTPVDEEPSLLARGVHDGGPPPDRCPRLSCAGAEHFHHIGGAFCETAVREACPAPARSCRRLVPAGAGLVSALPQSRASVSHSCLRRAFATSKGHQIMPNGSCLLVRDVPTISPFHADRSSLGTRISAGSQASVASQPQSVLVAEMNGGPTVTLPTRASAARGLSRLTSP